MKRALTLGLSLVCWPSLALAHDPAPAPAAATEAAGADPSSALGTSGVHVVDDDEPLPPLVPRAKDLLSGHLLVGASAGSVWSLGKLGSDVATVRGLGTGLGLQADIGFGLSRSVSVGVWGNYARYSDGDRCDTVDPANPQACSGYGFSVGPFVRYHLSQGLRFDPWLLIGAGYRQVSFEATGPHEGEPPVLTEAQTYSGLSFLRLEMGADYYVLSGIGFGPYGALSLNSYTKRPAAAGDAAVNTELSVGLRFLFDLPGR